MSKKATSHDAITIINKKKQEVTLFIVITLVVLIVLISFPIRLMVLSVININNEIEGKRIIKEQLHTKISNLNQLNDQYQEIRENLEDFPLIFPNQGDYSLFVANIEEICSSNNFQLKGVGVSHDRARRNEEEQVFEVLDTWSSNLSVVGKRSDLIDLLESFEAMPMYPTVASVSYENEDGEGAEKDLLNFSVTLQIYGVKSPGVYLDI